MTNEEKVTIMTSFTLSQVFEVDRYEVCYYPRETFYFPLLHKLLDLDVFVKYIDS